MNFIVDVFFEMLAMLLGLLGMVATVGGVVVTIAGFLFTVSAVSNFLAQNLFDPATLPSWFGWILGVMVIAVGILMMSLSSVMRKRIGRAKR